MLHLLLIVASYAEDPPRNIRITGVEWEGCLLFSFPFVKYGWEKYSILNCMSSEKSNILNLSSKRLKELIKFRLKITQKSFAKNIGIEESFLSMVINGNSNPSADMIIGIYLNYREHFDWLLTGESNVTAEEIKEHPFKRRAYDKSEEMSSAINKIMEVFSSGDDMKKNVLRACMDDVDIKKRIEKLEFDVKEIREFLERITRTAKKTTTG